MTTFAEHSALARRLPPAFAEFEGERPDQLAAGSQGKVGVLKLRFERAGGRTRLARLYATGPQKVQRVHYLDEALPDMAVVFIQSVGGGILQGDRLAVEIEVGPGARALVTTQSATKVYRMERNYATQRVAARVEPGAHLELLTDYLIPYAGARLYTEVDLSVAGDATAVYADGIASGRAASGESFAYRLLHTRLRARDCGGTLRLADTTVLAPGQAEPSRPGLLGGLADIGSLAVLCPSAQIGELAEDIMAGLEGDGLRGGASTLPGGDGVSVRVLGRSQRPVQTALHHAWRRSRSALLGTGVPPIHTLKYGSEPPPPGGLEAGGTS